MYLRLEADADTPQGKVAGGVLLPSGPQIYPTGERGAQEAVEALLEPRRPTSTAKLLDNLQRLLSPFPEKPCWYSSALRTLEAPS